MKINKKGIILIIISIFVISSLPGESISSSDFNNEDPSGTVNRGILSINPEVRNIGGLREGDTKTVSFEISNDGVSDPLNKDYYLSINWDIKIPDFFMDHVTVSPTSGVLTPGVIDFYGEISYDEDNSCTVTVDLDTTGLSSGIYDCEIEIIDSNNNCLGTFSLKFYVDAVLLSYSPKKDSMRIGKPDKKDFSFEIWNSGFSSLDYNFDIACYRTTYCCPSHQYGLTKITEEFRDDWVNLDKNSGSSTGEKDKITLTVDSSSLTALTMENSWIHEGKVYPFRDYGGYFYKCEININSNGFNNGGEGKITLEVKVGSSGIEFSIGKGDFLDFGTLKRGENKTESFQIWSESKGAIEWSIEIPSKFENFISVDPMNGVSNGPDDKCEVKVTVLTDHVKPGLNQQYFAVKTDDPFSYTPPEKYEFPEIYDDGDDDPYTFNFDGWGYPKVNVRYYLSIVDPNDSYDMVIIAPNYFIDYPVSYSKLCDLKEAHEKNDGFNVKIMNLKDIYNDYRRVKPNSLSNLHYSLAVREFLRDAYFNWDHGSKKPFYVLFIGDDNWNMFYEGGWTKVGNPPPGYPEIGNNMDLIPGYDENYNSWVTWGHEHYWNYSVECPTFQTDTGYTSSSDKDDFDVEKGWKNYFIPIGEIPDSITVRVNTLSPYYEEDYCPVHDSCGGYTGDIHDKTPRNFYVNKIVGYSSSQPKIGDYYFPEHMLDKHVYTADLGGKKFEYTSSEKEFNACGWNLSVSEYKGNTSRARSVEDPAGGGFVSFTAADEDQKFYGVRITVYNHGIRNYDNFVVRVNGDVVLRCINGGIMYGGGDAITTASDMPYSCLGEEYNPQLIKNKFTEYDLPGYNSYTGAVSLLDQDPDLFVGRAPVRSHQELRNFVDKTISFIESPVTEEYLNAAFVSQFRGLVSNNDGSQSPLFGWPWKNFSVDGIGNFDMGRVGCVKIIKLKGSSMTIEGESPSQMHFYSNHNTVGVPSTIYNIKNFHDIPVYYLGLDEYNLWSGGWDGEDIVDLINNGVGLINHMGSSKTPDWVINEEYSNYLQDRGIAEPYDALRLSPLDIRDHTQVDKYGNAIEEKGLKNTDTYPIIFSMAAYGGMFDNVYSRQIGELLIVDRNGPVAGVFNSWTTPDLPTESGYDRVFWNAVFGKGMNTLGDAFYEMKKDVGNMHGLSLFGDPALKIKGAKKITPKPEVESKNLAFGSLDFNNSYSETFEVYNKGNGKLMWNLGFQKKKHIHLFNRLFESNSNLKKSKFEDTLVNNFYKVLIDIKSDSDLSPYFGMEKFAYVTSFVHPPNIRGSSVGPNDRTTVTVTVDVPDINTCIDMINDIIATQNLKEDTLIFYGVEELKDLAERCISNAFKMDVKLDYNFDGTNYQNNDEFITLMGNVEPPVVSDIPDQSIFVGDSFSDINLDSFVSDSDTPIEDISWSVSGNSNISVDISWDNVASIGYSSGWTGCKSFTFTATDDMGLSDSTEVVFEVSYDPDNNRAVISMPSPVNGSVGIPIDIGMLSVNIADIDGDSFDWSITTVPDIGGSSGVGVYSGFKSCSISGPLSYNTSYEWVVSAVDSGSGRVNRNVFVFTTECDPNEDGHSGDDDSESGDSEDGNDDGGSGDEGSNGGESTVNNAPVVSIVNPSNNSVDVSVNISEIEVDISDSEGDSFSWSVSAVSDIGSISQVGDVNGTKSCSVSGLEYNTSYSVFVNATDVGSGNTTSCVFGFTTESNGSDEDNESGDSEPVDVSVDIVSPVDGGLYLFNKLKFTLFKTVVIGGFDFVVNVSGSNISSVRNIGFYVGGDLIDNVSFNKSISEYVFSCDRNLFGFYDFNVKLIGSENNVLSSDYLDDVIIINFPFL